jgi:hypothetical protein
MMSDSKDIDIMHGLKGRVVSAYQRVPTTHWGCGMETRLRKPFIEPEGHELATVVQVAGEWCRIFKIENFIPHGIHFIPS